MNPGYTLVEAAAAMGVLSLTAAALASGIAVFARSIRDSDLAAREFQDSRVATQFLERAAAEGAPFRATDGARFTGTPRGVVLECGVRKCQANITRDQADHPVMRAEREGDAPRSFRLGRWGLRRRVQERRLGHLDKRPPGRTSHLVAT